MELKEWQKQVRETFAAMQSRSKPYKIRVVGMDIIVMPNVYSPAYFADSEWFAWNISMIVGSKSLLEIGTGTGVVALCAALGGAKVTATDINPAATANARLNFREYNLDSRVLEGDMYKPLKDERFDFIFWNHPNNSGLARNMLELAGFDIGYRALQRYVAGAASHLSEQGRLLLGTSNFADNGMIWQIAAKNNYKILRLKNRTTQLGKFKTQTEWRIYEFRR